MPSFSRSLFHDGKNRARRAVRTKDGVISLSDPVRCSLRVPDRIPIGEVRCAWALDFLKAWARANRVALAPSMREPRWANGLSPHSRHLPWCICAIGQAGGITSSMRNAIGCDRRAWQDALHLSAAL